MLSVANLLAGPHGQGSTPYQKPLKVVVVAVAPTHNYIKDGQEKSVTEIGLADSTGAIKALCWDKTKLGIMKTDDVVMLRNYIMRDGLVVVTAATKASKSSGAIIIADEIKTRARNLVLQAAAPVVTIAAAKLVPVGQLTSISGKVVREEGVVNRQTARGEVIVRSVYVKDQTGEARVSLWNEVSGTETPVSSFLQISNIKVGNVYKGQVTFNSTSRTDIKEIQQPEETVEVIIDGCYPEEDEVILVCKRDEDFLDYFIPQELLREAVCIEGSSLQEVLDGLCLMCPLPAKITFKELNGKKSIKTLTVL